MSLEKIGGEIRDLAMVPVDMDHVIAVIQPVQLISPPNVIRDICRMRRPTQIVLA